MPFSTPLKRWCRQHPVRLCVLFGSQATGRTHPESDVDLALWPAEPVAPETKLAWLNDLLALLDREVSLVLITPDLDPVLGFEIVRDGIPIYEAEPDTWSRERFRLWQQYTDALPFRRHAIRRLKEYAQEVLDGS